MGEEELSRVNVGGRGEGGGGEGAFKVAGRGKREGGGGGGEVDAADLSIEDGGFVRAVAVLSHRVQAPRYLLTLSLTLITCLHAWSYLLTGLVLNACSQAWS